MTAGKLYTVLPDKGFFTVERPTEETYIDKNGNTQTAAANVPRIDHSKGVPALLITTDNIYKDISLIEEGTIFIDAFLSSEISRLIKVDERINISARIADGILRVEYNINGVEGNTEFSATIDRIKLAISFNSQGWELYVNSLLFDYGQYNSYFHSVLTVGGSGRIWAPSISMDGRKYTSKELEKLTKYGRINISEAIYFEEDYVEEGYVNNQEITLQ